MALPQSPRMERIQLGYFDAGGGHRAAAMYSLIITCKMNDIDPQVWLADVLARIATHPAHRIDELLPWNWVPAASTTAAIAA